MISRKLISFLVLSLFIVTTSFAQSKVEIVLTGLDVVPAVHTPATGAAAVWVQSDTLYVRGEFSDLMSPYFAANIHYGEEGESGNPIYSLKTDLSDDHTSGIFDPGKNKFALSGAMKEAFENGNLYINIASERHQRGEIRGQINKY